MNRPNRSVYTSGAGRPRTGLSQQRFECDQMLAAVCRERVLSARLTSCPSEKVGGSARLSTSAHGERRPTPAVTGVGAAREPLPKRPALVHP